MESKNQNTTLYSTDGQSIEVEDDDPNLLNTSLSDYHDYEPRLEFDDSELIASTTLDSIPPELLDMSDDFSRLSAIGSIEENFEKELAVDALSELDSSSHAFETSGLNRSGAIEVVGDDVIGRRIIVISACQLPPNNNVNPDEFLRYLMYTLDKYVEQDYSVVYFHYGLPENRNPPLSWMWKAYRTLDRKYKKNLKALYLVHPTNLIRIVWQVLRPAISVKFGRKMMYVNYLHELREHLDLDKICIPEEVLKHDKFILSKNPKAARIASLMLQKSVDSVEQGEASASMPPTQQFGVSLQFIKKNNTDMQDNIPPIVRQCIEFLSQPDALETEGIFRRSANVAVVKDLQRSCNRGERISFRNDPHIAAVLLKIVAKGGQTQKCESNGV
ncbi:unnamed protein product [Leptidea sinapis]|uniref:Rho-GAP domain-containing protein n=1 Tax=Leptidea sinapis TaxID=189913 RepID=A0A5E4QB40_9NEOP|nr:unnamed protein product [Leptidea sinapis]